MSDIKWFKKDRLFYGNKKISHIRSLPQGYKHLFVWDCLIALSVDFGGAVLISENLPYSVKDLSNLLNFTPNFIQNSIKIYSKLDMILIENNTIYLKNFPKYQNTYDIDKVRAKGRERVKRYREKLNNVTLQCNVTETLCNADRVKSIELRDKENIKEKSPSLKNKKEKPLTTPEEYEKIKQVITYLNNKAFKKYTAEKKNTIILLKALLKTYSVADFRNVINNKVNEWAGDTKMEQYLRPETLFGNKFESYYNALPYELRIKEGQSI